MPAKKKETAAVSKKASNKNAAKDGASKRLIILDAHAILHRAYHALPDFASSKGEPTGALFGIASMLMRIINDLKPDHLIAAYDLPSPTYRHEAYAGYKAGRKKTDDALTAQIERSRDVFAAFNIPIYEKAGFEADDIIGTIAALAKDEPGLETIIASGDMDTMQLIEGKKVRVYTLKKGLTDTVLYDEAAIIERFKFAPKLIADYKGLRGDPSDNIIGVPGIGEKTATELITNFGCIEDIYAALKLSPEKFKEVGIKDRIAGLLREHEEEALFSKMLATIRCDVPIEFELPSTGWSEGFDPKKVLDLFAELEFRTLGARLKELFGVSGSGAASTEGVFAPDASAAGIDAGQSPLDTLPEDELAKLRIAVWLLDSSISDASPEDMLRTAKMKTLADAKTVILSEISKRGLSRVYEDIELPLMPVLARMRETGMKVDLAYLSDLAVKYRETLGAIEKRIFEHAGGPFNINSPRQLGEIIFDKLELSVKGLKKTAGGARSTRESELEKLKDAHPIIADILEYREFQKLLSTYIDNIPHQVDDAGRVHTTLIQTGAATGRMASHNPNLQNIPVKSELGRAIRKAFVAEKGFRFVSVDYSQIELRIAAILSGDEKLKDIFRSGEDLHASVASRVFGVPAAEVTKAMRSKAKVINFGVLYGMGVNALRQNMGVSRPEAEEAYHQYFETFSGLASYLEEVKVKAAANGYTETMFGRRRYFEGIRSKVPYIRAAAERMAINAPIQGTQADIIKIAMFRIDEWLSGVGLLDDVRMLLQVHDELLFEIKEENVADAVSRIKEIMESVLPAGEAAGVPIVAEAAAGRSWGELERLG
jgi:DNA polymerase I